MAQSSGIGKCVCDAMYTRDSSNSNIYIRMCGTKRKRSGSSYTNLLSHLQSLHPDAYERPLTGREITQSQMDSYFVTSRAGNLH